MELRGPRLLLRQQALEWPVHWPGGLQEEVFGEEQLQVLLLLGLEVVLELRYLQCQETRQT